jgi:hypothetical protein
MPAKTSEGAVEALTQERESYKQPKRTAPGAVDISVEHLRWTIGKMFRDPSCVLNVADFRLSDCVLIVRGPDIKEDLAKAFRK